MLIHEVLTIYLALLATKSEFAQNIYLGDLPPNMTYFR